MTFRPNLDGEHDSERAGVLPYALVTLSISLVLTLGVLEIPRFLRPRCGSRLNRARTDAQTVSSASMQYLLDTMTCPKGVDALSGGYLSDSTRLDDPWGKPFRIYCANTGSTRDEVYVCSDGPNQLHRDADDLCDPASVREESLMWNSALGAADEPRRPAWAPRWAAADPAGPWKKPD